MLSTALTHGVPVSVQFTDAHSCFVTLSPSLLPYFGAFSHGPLRFHAATTHGASPRHVYLWWNGVAATSSQLSSFYEVHMSRCLAECLGLCPSNVAAATAFQISAVPMTSVHRAQRVRLRCASDVDWELADLFQETIQRSLLEQCCLVAAGQPVLIWVSPSLCVRLIAEEECEAELTLLGDASEVEILPPRSPAATTPSRPSRTATPSLVSNKQQRVKRDVEVRARVMPFCASRHRRFGEVALVDPLIGRLLSLVVQSGSIDSNASVTDARPRVQLLVRREAATVLQTVTRAAICGVEVDDSLPPGHLSLPSSAFYCLTRGYGSTRGAATFSSLAGSSVTLCVIDHATSGSQPQLLTASSQSPLFLRQLRVRQLMCSTCSTRRGSSSYMYDSPNDGGGGAAADASGSTSSTSSRHSGGEAAHVATPLLELWRLWLSRNCGVQLSLGSFVSISDDAHSPQRVCFTVCPADEMLLPPEKEPAAAAAARHVPPVVSSLPSARSHALETAIAAHAPSDAAVLQNDDDTVFVWLYDISRGSWYKYFTSRRRREDANCSTVELGHGGDVIHRVLVGPPLQLQSCPLCECYGAFTLCDEEPQQQQQQHVAPPLCDSMLTTAQRLVVDRLIWRVQRHARIWAAACFSAGSIDDDSSLSSSISDRISATTATSGISDRMSTITAPLTSGGSNGSSVTTASSHAVIVGGRGAGKSTALSHILRACREGSSATAVVKHAVSPPLPLLHQGFSDPPLHVEVLRCRHLSLSPRRSDTVEAIVCAWARATLFAPSVIAIEDIHLLAPSRAPGDDEEVERRAGDGGADDGSGMQGGVSGGSLSAAFYTKHGEIGELLTHGIAVLLTSLMSEGVPTAALTQYGSAEALCAAPRSEVTAAVLKHMRVQSSLRFSSISHSAQRSGSASSICVLATAPSLRSIHPLLHRLGAFDFSMELPGEIVSHDELSRVLLQSLTARLQALRSLHARDGEHDQQPTKSLAFSIAPSIVSGWGGQHQFAAAARPSLCDKQQQQCACVPCGASSRRDCNFVASAAGNCPDCGDTPVPAVGDPLQSSTVVTSTVELALAATPSPASSTAAATGESAVRGPVEKRSVGLSLADIHGLCESAWRIAVERAAAACTISAPAAAIAVSAEVKRATAAVPTSLTDSDVTCGKGSFTSSYCSAIVPPVSHCNGTVAAVSESCLPASTSQLLQLDVILEPEHLFAAATSFASGSPSYFNPSATASSTAVISGRFTIAAAAAGAAGADRLDAPYAVLPSVRAWPGVGGLAEARRALFDAIGLPVAHSELFSRSPIRLPRGVLLYGPPGCGKTLLASATAAACGLRLLCVRGPEVLDKYIGASEAAVRSVFARARASAPCLLFFDEFDSIAPRRGSGGGGGGAGAAVTDRVVNQLLTLLDGVESATAMAGVYVMAASARPDLLDPALLRPGRIDMALYVGLPSAQERAEILTLHAAGVDADAAVAAALPFVGVSDACAGFTGADLRSVITSARLAAVNATLAERQHRARGDGDDAASSPPVVVRLPHLLTALSVAKPSLSPRDRAFYEALSARFRRAREGEEDGAVEVAGSDVGQLGSYE